jgi:hypothetical protein
MLFLSVRRFLDYAELTDHSRCYAASHVAFSVGDGIGVSVEILFEAQSPGPPMPLSTLRHHLAAAIARLRVRMDSLLLSCRVGIELGRVGL